MKDMQCPLKDDCKGLEGCPELVVEGPRPIEGIESSGRAVQNNLPSSSSTRRSTTHNASAGGDLSIHS